MLDDIVPAIEGVMTVLPEPVQRPRNPEVNLRLSINTSWTPLSGMFQVCLLSATFSYVRVIDLTQVDAVYGAEKDGVWYRVRVERCLLTCFSPTSTSICICQAVAG